MLLPAFLLGRRLDVVDVIWSALRACVDGFGWRRLATLVDRPASTVRGWTARARMRAGMVRDRFTQLEHLLVAADGDDRTHRSIWGSATPLPAATLNRTS